jgi:ammonium transporter
VVIVQEQLDILWILVTAALVFIMQAGFMCLESGFTRAKNSINVAIKNMTDFLVATCLFWAFGFGLMFGMTWQGWIGADSFLLDFALVGEWQTAFFIFQTMFCATAATIVSGAVAERIRYDTYIVLTCIISALIYPVYGHWVWNGADGRSDGGWLGAMGFVDFAGSTVVHSVGGWVSLAALLVIGARDGRFGKDGSSNPITGYNLPMSVLGALLLYLGWFGFNGGSTLAFNDQVAKIIANTFLAGATGGVTALLIGWQIKKVPDVTLVVNGSLAGLVAITANCHVVSAPSAALIGVGGAIAMLLVEMLLHRFRVDDAVSAVPVHLGAGAWGTLAVALFGDPELIGKGLTMERQLMVQAIGILTAGVWAFGVSYLLLLIINRFIPLRVSLDAEHKGLNYSEHGATTELIDLLNTMESQGRSGDLSMRVKVEPFTEVGQIARQYNRVMDLLQKVAARSEAIIRDIGEGIITYAEGGVMTSFNPGAEKLFGGRRSDFIGKPVTMLFAGDSAGNLLPLERIMLWGTRPEGATVWACRRDRTQFPADIRVSASEIGGAPSYTVLVKDITERKRAEDALRSSRTRMQRHNQALAALTALHQQYDNNLGGLVAAIAAAAMDTLRLRAVTVWRRQPESTVYELFGESSQSANAQARPLQLSPNGPLGMLLRDERVVSLADAQADPRAQEIRDTYLVPRDVRAMLAVQLRLGGREWGLVSFEFSGGKREWFPEELVFAASVADFVAMGIEASERGRAEDEVRRFNEELEERVSRRTIELQQANAELQDALERIERTQNHLVNVEKMAALGELVAGVAHEINTPVGVAVTGASFLREKTRQILESFEAGQLKRSDFEAYIRLAAESSRMLMNNLERAAELVQSFKKVAVDQSSEAMRVFRIVEYTHEVLLSLRPKLKQTQHQILVEGADDLEIESYPGLLSQIITNLIINSLVHAFEDTKTGIIRLRYELRDGELVFTYTDNGKGIPQEILGRIFDPFFTTRRGRGGSGLGLHILYNIVSGRLGGTIDCKSIIGEGTTFQMTLPLKANQGSAHGL